MFWKAKSTPEAQGDLAAIQNKVTAFLTDLGARPELLMRDTTWFNYKNQFKFSVQLLIEAVNEEAPNGLNGRS